MTPVSIKTPKGGAIQLTPEDLKVLESIHLISGSGHTTDYIMHKMCMMQACTLLTMPPSLRERVLKGDVPEEWTEENEDEGNPLGYYPICVSAEITSYLVHLNDSINNDEERDRLLAVIPEIMNTCPVVRRTYKTKVVERRSGSLTYLTAEDKRAKILCRIRENSKYHSLEEKLALVREAANVLRTAPAVPE